MAAFILLICGIILTGAAMKRREGALAALGAKERAVLVSHADSDKPAVTKRRAREDESILYQSQDGSEKLKVAMDSFLSRNEVTRDEILKLVPPATPATLRKRLAEHEAPLGVFPIAYEENGDSGQWVTITSQIRAKIPRDEAQRLASSMGLEIVDFPTYAPDWVVFAAADPIAALEKIAEVRGDKSVLSADVLTGRRATLMAMPNDTLIDDQWHLKSSGAALAGTDMNVEAAWSYPGNGGVRGRGVMIGIVDEGMQTSHPDFVGNVNTVIDRDFLDSDSDPNPVYSDENHGTAVGGVAAARGDNALGVSGVAPEATLVSERLIAGPITDYQVANALNYRSDIIQIKNNSWGYDPFFKIGSLTRSALKDSCENGRGGKGTIFTFAAGNSGASMDNADYSELTASIYTIAVGGTDSLHRHVYYSEPGANLVISTPTHGYNGALGISTTDRTGSDGSNIGTGTAGDYTNGFNGTSSSCPAASGAIALMLEKNPNLGWRDVQEILIRSAVKFNPAESGWFTNGAGLHFNNDYGAGLLDATAAVNLAATWTNLGPQVSAKSTKVDLGLSIPNNSSTGRILQFSMPTSNITTEHVTVRLTIAHSARGELEISVFSPSGTESKLALLRSDTASDYDDWTFSTVQNWGENSSGVWTLKIADRSNDTNTTGGTVNAAEIVVFGAAAPPINPAPIVQIISPQSGAIFSPGVPFTINVDATDYDINKVQDTVTKVDLYENGIMVATTTSYPYSFTRNPSNASYTYNVKATDPDGLEGKSLPVLVTVRNQTPAINSVTLNAASQAYDDLPLTASVNATDPENAAITLAYKWEYSTDEVNYTNSGVITATLPANSANSSKLWRCVITASDGNTTSDPFVTGSVNLLDRPLSGGVRPGSPYNYQSGLVLRGDTLVINRQAIIQEFSQGSVGGTNEWIEILTLKAGSLAGWTLSNYSGNALTFASGSWTNVPAGTLIVIYNGLVPKDPVLPADSSNLTTGSVVISSLDTTHFSAGSKWPTLDNLGDSIYLKNPVGVSIHEVSYGNSLFASPNVGQVGAGQAAYYSGLSDAGASQANQWLVTASTVARTAAFTAAITPPATNSIFPAAVFTNGRYTQDFNNVPGVSGTLFPTGWTSYSVDLANTQTTNYNNLTLLQNANGGGAAFNFDSRIGMVSGSISGGPIRYDPGFIALALDNTQGLSGLQISYDIIKISEQAKQMELNLQYTTGNPENTGTIWTSVAGASYNSGSTPKGTVNRLNNIPLPLIFQDRISPIYLRWNYRTATNNMAGGLPDALAIDNLIISSNTSPNIYMTLTLNPSVVSETAGANASTGTVKINQVVAYDLTVNISSSDITEADVPASIVIPAGKLSGTFPIRAVDDIVSDGVQSSTITCSATNLLNVSQVLTVTDNEPILIGVTPGLPNNPSNRNFVDRLRAGRLYEAPAYYIAASTPLPAGLVIDSVTGLISGNISPTAALGTYSVIIEIRNVLGGFSSQTIVIVVSNTIFSSYSQWVAQFGSIDKSVNGNTDNDDLPNLIEYALGSRPDVFERPSPLVSARTSTAISITYSKSKNVTDVTLVAEWSPSMAPGSWVTTGILNETLVDGVNTQQIRSSVTIDPANPARFIRLKAIGPPPPP